MKNSTPIFVRLIQHRLDHQNLDCAICQRLYEQGDLADEQGRTIDRGGCAPHDFRCELCPLRIMPEPDAVTEKANEVYAYMARNPYPDHPADMEFIFKLMGLRLGSDESRAVYDRVLTRIGLEREYREKREGKASTNGRQETPTGRRDLGPP